MMGAGKTAVYVVVRLARNHDEGAMPTTLLTRMHRRSAHHIPQVKSVPTKTRRGRAGLTLHRPAVWVARSRSVYQDGVPVHSAPHRLDIHSKLGVNRHPHEVDAEILCGRVVVAATVCIKA